MNSLKGNSLKHPNPNLTWNSHICVRVCVYMAFDIHGNQAGFILKEKIQYFHWMIQ